MLMVSGVLHVAGWDTSTEPKLVEKAAEVNFPGFKVPATKELEEAVCHVNWVPHDHL
jgi:hypothetical protein